MTLEQCLDHFSEFIDFETRAQIKINQDFEDGWKGTDKEIKQVRADQIEIVKQELRDNTFTFDPELTWYFSDNKIAVDGWFDQ